MEANLYKRKRLDKYQSINNNDSVSEKYHKLDSLMQVKGFQRENND